MKKNIIAVIALATIWGTALHGQASSGGNAAKSYVGDINKIFPPVPASNNLMKFEEVPVSYYTGIPDISIPLFLFQLLILKYLLQCSSSTTH